MILAIHMRAPSFFRSTLLGTFKEERHLSQNGIGGDTFPVLKGNLQVRVSEHQRGEF